MPIKKVVKKSKPAKVVAPILDEEVVANEPIETTEAEEKGPEKYYETVGRRKESIARVRLFTKKSTDVVG